MRPAALFLLILAGCATVNAEDDRDAIRRLLAEQADAWNRGDLETFLHGYWRSPETVFAGGGSVHRGFEAMASRYRQTYGSPEKMGKLAFSNLVFESVAQEQAIVTGSWELSLRDQEKRPGGVFTLIVRRLPEGWRIVHDHTSSR